MKPNISRLAITTGDHDGIGPEVTTKALVKTKSRDSFRFYLWRSPSFPKTYLEHIDSVWTRVVVNTWEEALGMTNIGPNTLVDICSPSTPPQWVEESGYAGARGELDALVTAPLSKETIAASGLKDCGHTDILRRTTETENVFMSFLGEKFNVTLVTGHVPIHKAYEQLCPKLLQHCLALTQSYAPRLASRSASRPIGLVGCSPHAGENGLIDTKEKDVYLPLIQKLNFDKVCVEGPLVPDVCFQEQYWDRYSMYVASYHDQGLIPFKMVHNNFGGVQLSMGLPFVRTSVDHGTAKDIYGKNIAREASMVNAIDVAVKLVEAKPIDW